jgi:hypothetical protein
MLVGYHEPGYLCPQRVGGDGAEVRRPRALLMYQAHTLLKPALPLGGHGASLLLANRLRFFSHGSQ